MVAGAPEDLLARRLVGRAADLEWLESRRSAASGGRGGAVLLLGPPGLGKSRLLHELRLRTTSHAVLVGRAVEGGAARPYRALAEALTGTLRGADDLDARQRSRLRAALDRLAPGGGLLDPGQDVLAVGEAVVAALESLGGARPALLCVDDVQWADEETLGVLEYLCDHTSAHGGLLVLAGRPATTVPQPPLDRLVQRRAVAVRELLPLPDAAVEELVLECLDVDAAPGELVAFVRGRADGSPYAVEELLAGLLRSGALVHAADQWQVVAHRLATVAPTTVAASLRRRIDDLAPGTRDVLEAAAVLGHSFDWRLLGPMTGRPDEVVLAGLREAAYAGLVGGEGTELAFRHALTRDEVLGGILGPQRAALAGRALDALLRRDPRPAGDAAELALGLAELAGHTQAWRELLLDTAREAVRYGGVATALARLRLLTEAPEETDELTGRALELTAYVQAVTGHVDAAEAAARRALEHLGAVPDAAGRRQRLHQELARAALAAGRVAEASRHLDEAGPAHPRTRVLAAHVALETGDLRAAREGALTVVGDPVAVDPEVLCEAYEVLGRCDRVTDVAAAEVWFDRALSTARESGQGIWAARALHELGTIDLLDTMRTDRLQQARRAAVATGVPATVVGADFHLAEALVARGEPGRGRAAAERAVALADRIGSPMLPWAWLTVARSYAHERDDAAMEAALDRALAAAPGDPAVRAGAEGRVRAMRALHEADRPGATAHLDAAVGLLALVPGHHFPHWGLWALLRTVDDPEAALPARELAASAGGSGTRFNVALLRAAEAVALGRSGERPAAAAAWADALTVLRGYESSEWLVRLVTWLGLERAWADGWGDPVRWAQDGVRWFSAHGYPPLATASRRFLHTAGAPAPRRGRGESEVPAQLAACGVTSREVDVLLLLREGLSNAQVAARLVLSPRTVEKHVASLLRKTGSADRTDLASFTPRPPGPDPAP